MFTNFYLIHHIQPKQRRLIIFVIISAIVLAFFAVPFNSNQTKNQPATNPTATKVAMIMQMYNCKNPKIYNAIMRTFDPVLVATVIAIESEFRVDAVSPAGARGLMQLTPDKLEDWKNVTKNIEVGASYLKEQLDRFGELDLAIAAYNAGPNSVAKYRGIPPYKETIQYVKKAKRFSLTLEKLILPRDTSKIEDKEV